MVIFKKAIPRRAFLRGMGATLALPLLDGMVPALAKTADVTAKQARRLAVFYVPNGIIMEKFTPAKEGAGFELPPILESLTPFRDQTLLISGLCHKKAFALPGEGGAGHARGCAVFLTGVHPKATEGADIHAGVSMDQIAAKEFGQHTQLASLELTLEPTETLGGCDTGYSCAYTSTISWRSPTTPIPMENHPRVVFERLFGDSDSTDAGERRARLETNHSILDSMTQEAGRFLSGLGARDRTKLGEYLDAVRDVERRVQMAEEQSSRELPVLERPAGIPESYEDHAKLMMDLQALAFQSDLTRVSTFMMSREFSNRSYREIGIPDPHHALTHHQGDALKIAKVTKINTYHVKLLSYLLGKMRNTPDGDGSLLDHSLILYGSGLSDGNLHLFTNMPALVIGGGGGKIKMGRHVRYPEDTPMSNLLVTMLDAVGVPVQSLGDSTGELELLSV